MSDPTTYDGIISQLPPTIEEDMNLQIQQAVRNRVDIIIVLDDDPTGTQTVYDVPVLTNWTYEVLMEALNQPFPLFYILTNSRSLWVASPAALQ